MFGNGVILVSLPPSPPQHHNHHHHHYHSYHHHHHHYHHHYHHHHSTTIIVITTTTVIIIIITTTTKSPHLLQGLTWARRHCKTSCRQFMPVSQKFISLLYKRVKCSQRGKVLNLRSRGFGVRFPQRQACEKRLGQALNLPVHFPLQHRSKVGSTVQLHMMLT